MLAEQALIDSLAYFGDTLAVLCYHVHGTYQTVEAGERHLFYGEPIIPTTVFDGTDQVFVENPPFTTIFENHIRAALSVTPYFNLYITEATASLDSGRFNLKIVTADTIPDDEIVAFVAITEDSLPGVYDIFNHACRFLFQFPVDLVYPDSLDTTITFDHRIPVNRMKTIVFIQDMDTKEVMQSIIREFEEE